MAFINPKFKCNTSSKVRVAPWKPNCQSLSLPALCVGHDIGNSSMFHVFGSRLHFSRDDGGCDVNPLHCSRHSWQKYKDLPVACSCIARFSFRGRHCQIILSEKTNYTWGCPQCQNANAMTSTTIDMLRFDLIWLTFLLTVGRWKVVYKLQFQASGAQFSAACIHVESFQNGHLSNWKSLFTLILISQGRARKLADELTP